MIRLARHVERDTPSLWTCSWRALLLLALFATLIEAKGASGITRRAHAIDSLAKTLASLFMVKERDVARAKYFMDIFQVQRQRTRRSPACFA